MSRQTPHWAFLATVFVTGTAILVLEVTAIRILAPFFGNTIYTFSSVIGVVLAALSLGYYTGGRLADQHASPQQFFRIIAFGGLSVIFVQALNVFLTPLIAFKLSLISGPPVVSFLLFFVPSFLLGLLSPYAIKLLHLNLPQQGIGHLSGQVFFWGTIGSLTGTFLTGFYLIPTFSLSQIMLSVGLSLTLLGVVGIFFVSSRPSRQPFLPLALLLTGAVLAWFVIKAQPSSANVVHTTEGIYQNITVLDHPYSNRPARHLYQDRNLSGSIYLDDGSVASRYIQYHQLYQLFRSDLKRALVIGGGAYLVPRQLLSTNDHVQVDTVEIEPNLDQLAHTYFGLPKSDRHQNIVTDGRRFLHDTNKQYDLIFSDAYHSFYSIPSHLATEEFMQLAKSRLTENGVFIANVASSLKNTNPSFAFSEINTFAKVFPHSYFFALDSPYSTAPQNMIFIGANSDQPLDLADPKISAHANPVMRQLANQAILLDQLPLSQHPILTDNFAPVDYMAAQLAKQL